MRTLIISISLFLLSCNIQQTEREIKGQINDAIEDVEMDIEVELDKNKSDFQQHYQKALTNAIDTAERRQLAALETTVSGTSKYLDSMRQEMNSLDVTDVNNWEYVRIGFLYKGVGDTLLSRLNSTAALAINTARTPTTKAAIKSVSDSLLLEQDPYKWKANKFESMNSLGASMILYDLQTELLKMGKLSISDY